ncbi:hypothetical protein ACFWPQ_44580 [Streptomyces sp. NPDC058464]|uniref:hypothetical protein n=1 Tax=Streptomyces sp. NPDC058464 TaxID=3346511 RepID=UPI00365C471A
MSPGAVDTPWWGFLPREQRQAQFEAAADAVPAGRVGRAEDVAVGIRCPVDATYVTGPVLPVDGGFTVA